MCRLIAFGGLCAALLVLPGGRSAGPRPGGKAEARKSSGPAKANPSLADKLRQTVHFKGIKDPKMTLKQVLDRLGKDYGLPFNVKEVAFKYENLNEVLRVPVAEGADIPPMRATLDTVLRKILWRVQVPSGATYLVRKDAIEITTGSFLAMEVWVQGFPGVTDYDAIEDELTKYKGPKFPLVHLSFRKRPLEDVLQELAEQVDLNIALDPGVGKKKASTPITIRVRNTPVDTALLMITDMAGLRPVQLDNVFYVTTPEKAKALAAAHAKARPRLSERELEEKRRREAERPPILPGPIYPRSEPDVIPKMRKAE
jgi:hypothetical protein